MSACCLRSSMNLWGNSAMQDCELVLQLNDRRAAAAFILRRQFVMCDERMIFEKRGNRAAKLPGTVSVNDADRTLICQGRFIEEFFKTGDRFIDRLSNHIQFR